MGALEMVLPPAPAAPPLAPSSNYSSARIAGKDFRTNLHVQLPLRRPKQNMETAKLQAERIPEKSEHAFLQRHGQKDEPRCSTSDILRLMDCLSLPGTEDIYSSLAQESAEVSDRRGAYELQVHIMKSGVRPTTTLFNRLLLMHVSCGRLDIAHHMFDKMPHKDFHSWAILILGCIEMEDYQSATSLFAAMLRHRDGISELLVLIMGCVLKACAMIEDLALGKQVHALCHKLGFVGKKLQLSGSLIRFYGKFRCLEDANRVLEQLSHSNTTVWVAKVTNDCREGHLDEVIYDFIQMGRLGIKKNVAVFSCVLKACDGVRLGQQVHANTIKLGFESDCMIRSGLVEMYGKYGLAKNAETVFRDVEDQRSFTCWNAMVASYMQNGFYIEAIKLLYQMKASGIEVQDTFLNEIRPPVGLSRDD